MEMEMTVSWRGRGDTRRDWMRCPMSDVRPSKHVLPTGLRPPKLFENPAE